MDCNFLITTQLQFLELFCPILKAAQRKKITKKNFKSIPFLFSFMSIKFFWLVQIQKKTKTTKNRYFDELYFGYDEPGITSVSDIMQLVGSTSLSSGVLNINAYFTTTPSYNVSIEAFLGFKGGYSANFVVVPDCLLGQVSANYSANCVNCSQGTVLKKKSKNTIKTKNY